MSQLEEIKSDNNLEITTEDHKQLRLLTDVQYNLINFYQANTKDNLTGFITKLKAEILKKYPGKTFSKYSVLNQLFDDTMPFPSDEEILHMPLPENLEKLVISNNEKIDLFKQIIIIQACQQLQLEKAVYDPYESFQIKKYQNIVDKIVSNQEIKNYFNNNTLETFNIGIKTKEFASTDQLIQFLEHIKKEENIFFERLIQGLYGFEIKDRLSPDNIKSFYEFWQKNQEDLKADSYFYDRDFWKETKGKNDLEKINNIQINYNALCSEIRDEKFINIVKTKIIEECKMLPNKDELKDFFVQEKSDLIKGILDLYANDKYLGVYVLKDIHDQEITYLKKIFKDKKDILTEKILKSLQDCSKELSESRDNYGIDNKFIVFLNSCKPIKKLLGSHPEISKIANEIFLDQVKHIEEKKREYYEFPKLYKRLEEDNLYFNNFRQILSENYGELIFFVDIEKKINRPDEINEEDKQKIKENLLSLIKKGHIDEFITWNRKLSRSLNIKLSTELIQEPYLNIMSKYAKNIFRQKTPADVIDDFLDFVNLYDDKAIILTKLDKQYVNFLKNIIKQKPSAGNINILVKFMNLLNSEQKASILTKLDKQYVNFLKNIIKQKPSAETVNELARFMGFLNSEQKVSILTKLEKQYVNLLKNIIKQKPSVKTVNDLALYMSLLNSEQKALILTKLDKQYVNFLKNIIKQKDINQICQQFSALGIDIRLNPYLITIGQSNQYLKKILEIAYLTKISNDRFEDPAKINIVDSFQRDLKTKISLNLKLKIYQALLVSKGICFDNLPLLNKFKDKNLINKEAYFNMVCESVLILDPTIENLINNPAKLGSNRQKIINKIIQYVEFEYRESGTIAEKNNRILLKLKNLRETFESTDSSIIEKRSLFLDMNSLEDSQDQIFRKKVTEYIGQGLTQNEAIQKIVIADFEELLIQSGSRVLSGNYIYQLEKTNLNEQDREILQQKIDRIKTIKQEADKYNRELYHRLIKLNSSDPAFVEAVIPLETSVSQVGPSLVTLPILEQAAMCDSLLGEIAKRQEENLGLHISVTNKISSGNLQSISSRLPSYGNPHGREVNRVYHHPSFDHHQPYGINGTPYSSFGMGSAHQCFYLGLPSTQINAIICNPNVTEEQKKQIAANGFFIPLLDNEGNVLWTPEEFDRMKLFYSILYRKGYNLNNIDKVYQYFETTIKDSSRPKHQIITAKAYEYLSQNYNQISRQVEDTAILADFLASNDLNTHDTDWYQAHSFIEIMDEIKNNVSYKNRWKARNLLFDYPENYDKTQPQPIAEVVKNTPSIKVKKDNLIHKYISQIQKLYSTDSGQTQISTRNSTKYLTNILFKSSLDDSGDTPNIDYSIIKQLAVDITRNRQELMRKIWQEAWDELRNDNLQDEQLKNKINKYQNLLIPVMSGSGGRQEMTIDSDLDYNILVDDDILTGSKRDLAIAELKEFANNQLASKINAKLNQYGIREDAGKTRQEEKAFSLISDIKNFKIDLKQRKQSEEPTVILDNVALFEQNQERVQQIKEDLIVHHPQAYLLDSFILRDLTQGLNKKSFAEEFEQTYENIASGQTISKVKESLQRTLLFKIDYLIIRAFQSQKINHDDAKLIPSGLLDKIDFLFENQILTNKEAKICKELWAIAYKIRFLSEVYRDQQKSSNFNLEDISYNERERLFYLLKKYKKNILYK